MVTTTRSGNIVNSKKRHFRNNNNTTRPPSSLDHIDFDSVHYEFEWEAIEVGLTLPEPKDEPVVATIVTSSAEIDDDDDEYNYKHPDEQAPTKSRTILYYSCIVIVVLLVLILIPIVVLLVLRWPRFPKETTTNTPPPPRPPWTPPEYAVEFAPRTLVLQSGGSILASELPAPLQFVSPSGLYQLSLTPRGELIIRRKLNVMTSTTPDRSSDNTTFFDRPRWRALQATDDDADEYYYYYDEDDDENKTDEEAENDTDYYYDYDEENTEYETTGADATITFTTGTAPTDLVASSSSESSADTNSDTVTVIEDTTIENTAEDEPATEEENEHDDEDKDAIGSSSVDTIMSVTDPTVTDTPVITDTWSDVVWRKEGFSDTVYRTSMAGGETHDVTRRIIKLSMQTDGNLVLRDTAEGITVWKSLTKANPEAYLVFDDEGQLQVIDPTTGYPLYLDGIPRSQSQSFQVGNDDDDETMAQNTDSSTSTQNDNSGRGNLGPYPVRGIFYYPWFPTTWASDDNQLAHYIPKLGQYDSSHYPTIVNHAQQLDYGNIQLGISSWWGPDTKSDKARFLLMLEASYYVTDGRLKWCIYFEPQDGDDTVGGIRAKLHYLQDWFVDHPSYARTSEDNKPVLFVYNRNNKDFDYDCHTIAKCWNEANSKKEWHIVLKLFSGWRDCDYQPDSWHQYGPSTQFHSQDASKFAPGFVNISPGFWHAKESEPRLERLTSTEWTDSVQRMAALRDDENNNIKWHLITSFNEAVEGTIIEATADWDTKSGMGYFLDALHHN